MSTKKHNNQEDKSRYHVPNLERALIILEYLASKATNCGISELAKALDIPKNSVFRIARTLSAYEYLKCNEDNKTYRLGRKLMLLGHAAIGEENLIEKSLDIMRQLRDEIHETVLLGTMIANEGVVLEQIPSDQAVKVTIQTGHRFPLHSAAPGKAMLAYLSADRLNTILAKMKFKKFTKNTITSKSAFRQLLTYTRRKGYSVDDREEHEELCCIAAPIFNHRGYPIAAIWMTAPAFRIKPKNFSQLGKSIIIKAQQISQRFGYDLLS